jgi:hypothetical protein
MNQDRKTPMWKIVLAWTVVVIPFAWGIAQTVKTAGNMFAH